MMKANYLVALACIALAACSDNSLEPATSRADRIQMLKEDLGKRFGTGPIDSATIKEDGMHLESKTNGRMMIPLKELRQLEQEASMDGKENLSLLKLQLFNNANAAGHCTWVNCGDGWPGQTPGNCRYAC
jgi:hypothetical protein